MPVTADTVVVELQARLSAYNTNINNAVRNFTQGMNRIGISAKGAERDVTTAFRGMAAGLGAAYFIREAGRLIDANIRIKNSLRVAGLEGQELEGVYQDLFQAAQRNSAPLESLTVLYGRLALSQAQLGVSTRELIGFTENVALALRVSDRSATEAQGALLQLSQALGSGVVRAEEFNSIIEGAPAIAQAAAAGIAEAGGSVAKLRQLMLDGKLSSEGFFRGFEAGSYILEERAASAESTVSNAFVRLQNVLIDVAGRFNENTDAAETLGNMLGFLGERILAAAQNFEDGTTPVQRFLDAILDGSERLGQAVGADNIGEWIKGAVDPAYAAAAAAETQRQATLDLEQEILSLILSMQGIYDEYTEGRMNDLIGALIGGGETAEQTMLHIEALGHVHPEFMEAATKINMLIGQLGTLQAAAAAARAEVANAAATAEVGNLGAFPTQVQFNLKMGIRPEPITLAQYPVTGGAGGGRRRGGGQSPQQKFSDSLDRVRERTAALGLETEAVTQSTFAAERAQIAFDLMNEAKAAGLTITPALTEQINAAADAYAEAAVTLEQTKAAQDRVNDAMEDAVNLGKDALKGWINDLREGKDAGEAFGNMLDKIADKLIDMAFNNLFANAFPTGGGSGGGLGGIGGFLAGLFGQGKANGGPVVPGKAYPVNERTPNSEWFIPDRAGSIIPAAKMNAGNGSPSISVTFAPTLNAPGADAAALERLKVEFAKSKAELPATIIKTVQTAKSGMVLK